MNFEKIKNLVQKIKSLNGQVDKDSLTHLIMKEFDLKKDSKIFFCEDFAIRFSKAEKRNMGNTILSLAKLKKYDDRPVICCAVLPSENYLVLCNSTFLQKISHSSQNLTINNIKGSFNHSDILKKYNDLENCSENFQELFEIHSKISFEDNLARLVAETSKIHPNKHKFVLTPEKEKVLLQAPIRANKFLQSEFYKKLLNNLTEKVDNVKEELLLAANIENVKLKGNIIEYLITSEDLSLRNELIYALRNNKPIPKFIVDNDLGDFNFNFGEFNTKTDIKAKVMNLKSNPKGYNVDKLLEFLSTENSVYLLYFVAIDKNNGIKVALCSVFENGLIDSANIIAHWAGRDSRGVAQFIGKNIAQIVTNGNTEIDIDKSVNYLLKLMNK